MKKNIVSLLFLFTNLYLFCKPQEITTYSDYKTHIKSNPKVVVLFSAEWCGVCKGIKKPFARVTKMQKYSDILFLHVDIEDGKEVADEVGIVGIPTFLFFKDGKQVRKEIGVQDTKNFKRHFSAMLKQIYD